MKVTVKFEDLPVPDELKVHLENATPGITHYSPRMSVRWELASSEDIADLLARFEAAVWKKAGKSKPVAKETPQLSTQALGDWELRKPTQADLFVACCEFQAYKTVNPPLGYVSATPNFNFVSIAPKPESEYFRLVCACQKCWAEITSGKEARPHASSP